LAHWLNFILSLHVNTQSKSPVIGLILTHKDKLPLSKQLVPIIATEDVQMWSIDARNVSKACSMLVACRSAC
jgi:hypothetical protein